MFISLYIDYKKIGKVHTLPILNIINDSAYFRIGDNKIGMEIKLKKRTDYPITYCKKVDDNIVLGYGPLTPTETDEYLQIVISKNGDLLIKRDLYTTLPLFYSFTDLVFYMSNDYSLVLDNTAIKKINDLHILETLIPNPDRQSTLFKDVHILGERTVLSILDKKINKLLPPSRSWAVSKNAAPQDPNDFPGILIKTLDNFIENKLNKQQFGFELSAGIDSSLLPLHFSKNYRVNEQYGGYMSFPDDFNKSQSEKIEQLKSYTNLNILKSEINIKTDYPLARIFNDRINNFYTFEEIYTEALDELACIFEAQGIKVIATGIGGDELFENVVSEYNELKYGKKEVNKREKTIFAPFFTQKYIKDYVGATPLSAPYPMPLLAVSALGAGLSRNNVYINHDIWPISPLADPSLYEFCQGLPAHFRANKNILRAFYQANAYPQAIYNPIQNEHFGNFFNKSLKLPVYQSKINEFSKKSKISNMGFVDTIKLLQMYSEILDGNKDLDKYIFNIFTWLILELNLEYL